MLTTWQDRERPCVMVHTNGWRFFSKPDSISILTCFCTSNPTADVVVVVRVGAVAPLHSLHAKWRRTPAMQQSTMIQLHTNMPLTSQEREETKTKTSSFWSSHRQVSSAHLGVWLQVVLLSHARLVDEKSKTRPQVVSQSKPLFEKFARKKTHQKSNRVSATEEVQSMNWNTPMRRHPWLSIPDELKYYNEKTLSWLSIPDHCQTDLPPNRQIGDFSSVFPVWKKSMCCVLPAMLTLILLHQ